MVMFFKWSLKVGLEAAIYVRNALKLKVLILMKTKSKDVLCKEDHR